MRAAEVVYQQMFRAYQGLIPIQEFQLWSYQYDDLLYDISPDLHLTLLTFDYDQQDLQQAFTSLLYKALAEIEAHQVNGKRKEIELKTVLEGIVHQVENWEQLMIYSYGELWDESTRFKFLDVLADIGAFSTFPLTALGLPAATQALRSKVISQLIYPKAKLEASLLLDWLDRGVIDIEWEYTYVDYRSEETKKRRIFDQLLQEIHLLTEEAKKE